VAVDPEYFKRTSGEQFERGVREAYTADAETEAAV